MVSGSSCDGMHRSGGRQKRRISLEEQERRSKKVAIAHAAGKITSSVLKPKNDTKSFPKPFEQSSLQKLRTKRVLGWILEGSGALLGVPGPAFVHSWPAPGLSGVLLGRLLGTSGELLAVFWPRWGASEPHFGSQVRPKPRF